MSECAPPNQGLTESKTPYDRPSIQCKTGFMAAETRSQWLPRNYSCNGSSTPVRTHLTWAPPGLIGLFLFLLATSN
ncbi:Acid phosphatase [Fusarium oxysporum f. sp. albedinis]|nr:Acid phosphatase [Fusarium oxysporum f. sp. albedinis]